MTDPSPPAAPAPPGQPDQPDQPAGPPPPGQPAVEGFPAPGDDPVTALEARLGQPLADRVTALAALTHKSFVNEHRGEALLDNERLEFLGDAVIDLAVSHRLMERFPGAREGDLSKMRAAVVDEQGLAAMARSIDLGALLRLGRGEELTGGRKKASLLADAMEAVVAAVYLEAGLAGVLRLVERFLGEAFARAAAGTLDRDYKTQLQELAQSRFKATPRYRVVAEQGPDHAKVFVVELDLRGEPIGRGSGKSKKDAEQAAAKPALELLARRCAAEGPGAVQAEAPATSPTEGEGTAPAPGAADRPAPIPAEPEAATPAPEPEPEAAPEPPGPLAPTLAAAQPESMEGSVEPVVSDAPTEGRPVRRKRAASPRASRAKAPKATAATRQAAATRPGKAPRARTAAVAKARKARSRRPRR